jgi:predicted component of type VI protein secretion system
MQVDLTVTNKHTGESNIISLTIDDRLLVGRDLRSPVQFQGVGLSREHFALSVGNGRLLVEDLSRNGTWLNGEFLGQNVTAPVEQGDVIEIPGHTLQVTFPELVPAASDPVSPATAALAQPAWARILSTTTHFFTGFEMILILAAAFTCFLILYYTSL